MRKRRGGVFSLRGTIFFTVLAALCLFTTYAGADQILLADFGGNGSENSFGPAGWDTVIKDSYRLFRNAFGNRLGMGHSHKGQLHGLP